MDKMFQDLHLLRQQGIIDSVPSRVVTPAMGRMAAFSKGSTESCAVDSSAWRNRHQGCRFWQMKIKDASLSDHLAIYHSRRNQEIAAGLAVLAICISVIVAIVQANS
ncbi:MAG: hypothetical protein HYV17_11810 [Xanthomonadales bacterium]|nr:hypothetical protein [Xanthomonadales bacterium]